MAETFTYDVFLSHSAKDKATVRKLAQRLKKDGLRVWFDEWEIQPGDNILGKIDEGLEQSRVLVLAMSKHAFAADWVTLERHTALFRDPSNRERRFIPLRLDDAEIKGPLRSFAYVDWRKAAAKQYRQFLEALGPRLEETPKKAPSRAKTGRSAVLKGHSDIVWSVAVSADGRRAVSGSYDRTVKVWDLQSGAELHSLAGHSGRVMSVAVSADGRRAVSGGYDPGSWDQTVKVWDLESGTALHSLAGHSREVLAVAVSADGRRAVSAGPPPTVKVWDLENGAELHSLTGHGSTVDSVAVTGDGRRAVSGSRDDTVRVWDLESYRCVSVLEGHTGDVNGVALTPDGRTALSGSTDRTVRVWQLGPIDTPRLAIRKQPEDTEAYTNAKVLLVGDSGVGKSGLAVRLTEDTFKPTESTDAHWATRLKLPHKSPQGTDREIWLWDFAGQADYRLIHQLFMDETSLAALVFNPQSEDPFEGLAQWARDLERAARRKFNKVLVAGRVDRGGLMISHKRIEEFAKSHGFGYYLETSAKTGRGCKALRKAIIDHIDWESIPYTASPRIFKLLKDAIVRLRDEDVVLLRMVELKQRLEMQLPKETFTLEELRAVVGLLAGPGLVWKLEFGDFVLLQPERIHSYAAAVIRSVRAHSDEIGAILEQKVLDGELDYQDMTRLPPDEEAIVLRAMHQSFVDHGLCLRESTDKGMQLVFPSYFKRERPELTGSPAVLVSYEFTGALDEIYATLVVRLHQTRAFDNDKLWRFAVDFKTPAGKTVGLKMTKKGEAKAEIAVYCQPGIPDDTKVTFIKYVHEHLEVRGEDVTRLRHYVCPHCDTPVANRKVAMERLGRGLKDIVCVGCEKRVPLWDLIEDKFASEEFRERVRLLQEQSQTGIDNESRELILVGHAFAIAGEAGQIFRPTPNSDWGIDGEIELKDYKGKASGKRVYLQLKSGDSYTYKRKGDDAEIFGVKKARHAAYWQQQAYPVMLVIRTSDKDIRWMNVSEYLREKSKGRKTPARQIVFDGEPFTALNLQLMRDKVLPPRA